MEKIRFITLCPKCRNIEILKDVGMIPFILGKEFSYKTKIVSFKNEKDYYSINQYLKSLDVEYLPFIVNENVSVLLYLLYNSKKIDVLNVYHYRAKSTLLYSYVYKLLNPKGLVYLKMDIDSVWIEKLKKMPPLKKMISGIFSRKVDIISAETHYSCIEVTKILNHKIEYIPNGYYWFDNQMAKKRNVILGVGRLGSNQKNYELLVDAFVLINSRDWELRLIGDSTAEFVEYLTLVKKENPTLKINHIENITSREEMHSIYAESKIFVLPSRWESFGLVLLEALSNCNYVITTDHVIAAQDIISENCGTIIKNESLSELVAALKNAMMITDNPTFSFEWERDKDFKWESICGQLDKVIKLKFDSKEPYIRK